MKKLLFSAALLVFAANVLAEPVEIDSKLTPLQVAKTYYKTEIDFSKCPITIEGKTGAVKQVTTAGRTRYYSCFKIVTNREMSKMQGFAYRFTKLDESNSLSVSFYCDDESKEKYDYGYSNPSEYIISNGDKLYNELWGDDYKGDIYCLVRSSEADINFRLEFFDLGEDNKLSHFYIYEETEGGFIAMENETNGREKAGIGDIVNIAAVPAAGYKWEGDLNVKVGSRELCLMEGNAFVMPKDDISVSATFTKTDNGGDENLDNGDNGNGNQNPTGVEDASVSAQSIVGEKFHTILGQPLNEPQESGVTVVTRTYSDGAVRSSKEVR